MNINGAFPNNSSYLRAADIIGKRVAVTIASVKMEDIGDDHKPVVYFVGKDKGLALNKTNASMIAEITGTEETDDWKGHAIVLYTAKVDYQGKRVDGIRVDAPGLGAMPPPAPKPAVAEPVGVDDIPF
jgi:hypothetical protein